MQLKTTFIKLGIMDGAGHPVGLERRAVVTDDQAVARVDHRGPTLGTIAVGESAVVKVVGGRRALASRLMEMGLLPGTRVEIVRVAPLGDPLELRLRGYSLSVRRADALEIEVDDVRRDLGR